MEAFVRQAGEFEHALPHEPLTAPRRLRQAALRATGLDHPVPRARRTLGAGRGGSALASGRDPLDPDARPDRERARAPFWRGFWRRSDGSRRAGGRHAPPADYLNPRWVGRGVSTRVGVVRDVARVHVANSALPVAALEGTAVWASTVPGRGLTRPPTRPGRARRTSRRAISRCESALVSARSGGASGAQHTIRTARRRACAAARRA
jgi:hypothetical protein